MNKFDTTMSKEELKAYILIYCANADFVISQIETDFIKSKVNVENFERIESELNTSNDYQSIQKILSSIERHDYSKDEKEILFKEIKELFLSDGKYNILEQNLFRGLNHLLITKHKHIFYLL